MRTALTKFGIRTVANTLPSWLPASGSGKLINSGNGFSGNLVATDVYPGAGVWDRDFTDFFTAWVGAAASSFNWFSMAPGGHNAWGGAESYIYEFNTETPGFRRLDDPISQSQIGDMPGDNGSRPNARHTYSTQVYDPTRNKIFLLGSPALGLNPGNDEYRIYGYDLATESWESVASYDAINVTGSAVGRGCIGYTDPNTGLICIRLSGNQPFYLFNPDASLGSQLTSIRTKSGTGDDATNAAGDPVRRIMLMGGGTGEETTIDMLHLDSPYEYVDNITVTGTPPNMLKGSLHYDPVHDDFVAWKGGNTFYILTPPAGTREDNWSLWSTGTWTWSTETISGDAAPTGVGGGMYNKCQYISGLDIYCTVAEWNQPMWVGKR